MISRAWAMSADGAVGDGLHHHVADGGGFDGAGDDAAAGGVGGHLAEQRVLRAAADDVDRLDPAADQLFQAAQHHAVAQRQALQRAANDRAFGLRRGLARSRRQ